MLNSAHAFRSNSGIVAHPFHLPLQIFQIEMEQTTSAAGLLELSCLLPTMMELCPLL